MKMVWRGVAETFKAARHTLTRISKTETLKVLTAMTFHLRAATPIDTGKARASWMLAGQYPRFSVINTTDYIEYLNQGSSEQAPQYFVERVALRYGRPIGAVVTVTNSPG